MLKFFAVSLLILGASFANAASPKMVHCMGTIVAVDGQPQSQLHYVLQTGANAAIYSVEMRVTGLDGKVVSDVKGDGLTCSFAKDLSVFNCLGGTRMNPVYASSKKITETSMEVGGAATTTETNTLSAYQGTFPEDGHAPTVANINSSACMIQK